MRALFVCAALCVVACAAASPGVGEDESNATEADDGSENDSDRVGTPAPPGALPKDYVSLSAEAKQEALWRVVSEGAYCPDAPYDSFKEHI